MTIIEIACDLLADLLVYPGADYPARIERCRQVLVASQPEAATLLREFEVGILSRGPVEREELFTRTFDCNPPCALEIGWHLFGESYDRGAFLVWMRGQLRRLAVPESTELPDHLTHVLAMLGRMDESEADSFAVQCVLPAVERILPALQDSGNPYEKLLAAIASTLRANHGTARPSRFRLPILRPEAGSAVELDGVAP
ncbi:MAG: hypothetical protein HY718_18075 [Planctomycetes bacterium]|nr:hypothetical protein [Planctomycetota bacterium]